MPANKAPAPVDTGPVSLTPVGPLDKGPAPVPQGTATGVYPPAPGSKIPQTSAPKPVAVSSKATEEDIIPVTEKAVDVGNTVQVNTNVSNAPPRYVNVYGNGSLVVQAASTLNFTGNGVSVTAGNSSGSAQIAITGGQGNVVVDWGNVGNSIIPNSNNTYDVGSGSNRWATMYAVDVNATGDVTAGGNISAGNFVGNGAGITGITQIVNGDNTWTFDASGGLNLSTYGVIRGPNAGAGLVNSVSSNFVQMQWADAGNVNIPDPNSTGGLTHWAYISSSGFSVETNYNDPGGSHFWNFDVVGNLTVPGYINNLSDPVQLQDAATKNYVDTVASGLHVHSAAQLASTQDLATYTGATVAYDNGASGVGATLTLSGNTLTTLDGTAIPASPTTRLLIKNQANAVQNGVYVYTSNSVLTRAPGEDTNGELNGGDFLFVLSGSTQADTGWVQTTDNVIIGTSNIVFAQFSSASMSQIVNGTSNVVVSNNGNVAVSVAGTSNVSVFTSTGLTLPFGPSNDLVDVNLVALTQALVA